VSRSGGGPHWGWILAIVAAAGVIFVVTHQDSVHSLLIAAGKVVGSTEGAGGSP
jgi:hypothetical protein